MKARIWFAIVFVLIGGVLAVLWRWSDGWVIAAIATVVGLDGAIRVRKRWFDAPQTSALLDVTIIFTGMSIVDVPDSALGVVFAYTLLAALVMLGRSWAIGTILYAAGLFTIVVRYPYLQGSALSDAQLVVSAVIVDLVFTAAFVTILTIFMRIVNRDANRRAHHIDLQEAIAEASSLLLDRATVDPIESALEALITGTDSRTAFLERNVTDEDLRLCSELVVEVAPAGTPVRERGSWPRLPWSRIGGRSRLELGEAHHVVVGEAAGPRAQHYNDIGIETELSVPIFVRGDWWGVVGFTNIFDSRPWAQSDHQLLHTAAALLASYVERSANAESLTKTVARLDREVQYGQALAKAAEILATSDDDSAVQRALEALRDATDADYAYIDENYHDPRRGLSARVIHDAVSPDSPPDGDGATLWFAGSYAQLPTAYAALREGRAVSIRTSELEGPERQLYEADGLRSELCIPVLVGTEWRGSVSFADYAVARQWTTREIEALEIAARMIGTFWERREATGALQRLVDSQQRRIDYERAVAACSNALLASDDDSAVDSALRLLVEATGAHSVFIDLNEHDPELGLVAVVKHEAVRAGFEQIVDEKIWMDEITRERRYAKTPYARLPDLLDYLERGRPLVVFPRLLTPDERAAHGSGACKSELNIPIVQQGQWVGSIGFSDFLDERPWDQGEVVLLQTVAEMIGTFWERAAATQRLEELVRSKDEFVASVSHELRTPLSGVLGLSSELHERFGDFTEDEVASFIEIISEQSADVAGIVDDLLVAARADIDMLTVDASEIEIRPLLESTIDDRLRAKFDRVEFGGPSLSVWADPGRLRQIVRNLVVNAARYGGSIVVIETARSPLGTCIRVRDDGDGIEPDRVERIFEPYGTAHFNRSQPGAVGLGLSVARHLARLMGGDLVYRREGDWTVFELDLPADRGLRAVG